MYHEPVMLEECLEGLEIKPNGVYVDVTFGGGGHSRAILERLGESGRLIAFDQDEDAWKNELSDERFVLVRQNFRHIKRFLRLHGVRKVDGVLADLGVSSHQFDVPERGFSTRFEWELDMRMDKDAPRTARQVVNEWEEDELRRVFKWYGDIPNPGAVAKAIVKSREGAEIATTEDLKRVVEPFVKGIEAKYHAKLFQAIRVEVNAEVDVLKEMIEQVGELMGEGGRFVVMSYHSLEDRLVKQYFKKGGFGKELVKDFYGHPQLIFREVNRKPIEASDEEVARNSRARSAKLRIGEKI